MTSDDISTDEFAQYDRQIRLWGLDAQKRLRLANVLMIGLGGLGSEVVKNIVLAGIHSITLLDSRIITDEDLCSQLLITPDQVGQNIAKASQARTQELNPNVIVNTDTDNVEEKENDFFGKFDVVCLTRCSEDLRLKLDTICRGKNIKFFCGDVFGFYGYCFSDLGTHEYAVEVPVKKKANNASGEPSKKKVKMEESITAKKVAKFCSYSEAMKEDWSKRSRKELRYSSSVFFILKIVDHFMADFNRLPQDGDQDEMNRIKSKVLSKNGMKENFVDEDFADFCLSVLSPVAAIVGGVLGQEIIKVISKKDQPHNNFFFIDGLNHQGVVDRICKK